MSFRLVKNWGLALLVFILLAFSALAHTESRLHRASINNIETVYRPMLHRITKLGHLLKSTEINFEIFRRRDIPLISSNAETIGMLQSRINELAVSSNEHHSAKMSIITRESKRSVVAWKRFESTWSQSKDLTSDDLQQWADSLSASLEELKWLLIELRDISVSEATTMQVAEALSLIKSADKDLDTFLTQEPIFVEDVLEPLHQFSKILSNVNDQAQLVNIDRKVSDEHIENHNHGADDHSNNQSPFANESTNKNTIHSINEATIEKANSLQSVLRSIQADGEIDSATHELKIELARSLITGIENQINLQEHRLDENLVAENQALFAKLDQYQKFRHIATVLGCLLALLISLFMSIRLSRHVALVTDGTRLLSEGQLDHRIPATSRDQLGDIANAFNVMAEKLRVRDHERDVFMEEIDRSAKEAAIASSAKGDFMASMSHEIRTPINGVLGTVDLLMREPLTRSQMHLTETIHRSGNTLLGVINDILDYSKIEAGSMELENEPFNLTELIEDIGEMTAPSAHSKGLEINYLLDSDSSQQLVGDALRIRQILTNLVSNAIKFTEEGGVCIIAQSTPAPFNKVRVEIKVQDTGIGLSEEAQTRIFQAFSQASRSTTRKYGGTGLGLSISRQLTEMMDGELSLDSAPGVGSTFCLEVELSIAETMTEQKSLNSDGKLLNVMILSTHSETKLALSTQLKGFGINAIELHAGRKAIEHLRLSNTEVNNDVDLILVDLQLSDMSGLDFLRLANEKREELHGCEKIKLCMVDEPNYVFDELQNLQIEYTIKKPVRQSALFNCLMDICGVSSEYIDAPKEREMDPTFNADVLLVEDHPTNQDIVTRMLNIMGCTVTLAENGQIGLDILKQRTFDIVLMDCDMPVMNGFTATETFRIHESELNRDFRQPIVALTANALQGDRERCLRSGMDDYATKPLTMNMLEIVLSKWTTESTPDMAAPVNTNGKVIELNSTPNATNNEEADLLDTNIVNQLIMMDDSGSMSFFNELLANFATNWQTDFNSLLKALSANEQDNVRKMAHRLKSASATMGAISLASIAAEIELSAKESNLHFCESKAANLPVAFESTMNAYSLHINKAA